MTNNNLTDDRLAEMIAHVDGLVDCNVSYSELSVVLAELQQYRKAAGEPKYWLSVHRYQSYLKFTKADAERDVAENGGVYVVPLYTAPQLDYVLPSELLASMEEVIRISDRDHAAWDRVKAGISAYHTAMLPAIPKQEEQ
ncbi:hypothetical protein OVA10_15820 [Lelliottia sp. SL45]|uniref:hypothetical protein n=1 Tax=Lelliottia sp. SL45 TaxID=2994665 RepID=UPI002273ACDF|nr:hypothetical protein [Lelliottia sp. SL45]MCY1699513.1 hypothetical protein [Lelliottia sp. SL45]